MFNFFKGWRCKAGCVTLGLAATLMVLWIRSICVSDLIVLPAIHTRLFSTQGVCCIVLDGDHSRVEISDSGDKPYWTPHLGIPIFDGDREWHASYAIVTIPLTFLSALLLLWPSRRTRPRPAPVERAPDTT